MESIFKLEVVVKGCDEDGVLYHFIINNVCAKELVAVINFITDHVPDLYNILIARE